MSICNSWVDKSRNIFSGFFLFSLAESEKLSNRICIGCIAHQWCPSDPREWLTSRRILHSRKSHGTLFRVWGRSSRHRWFNAALNQDSGKQRNQRKRKRKVSKRAQPIYYPKPKDVRTDVAKQIYVKNNNSVK